MEVSGTGKGRKMFIREKKIDCNDYREVDIIPRTEEAEKAVKGERRKRQKVTEPKQQELNDKNAKRYLVQLGNGNFGVGDLHVCCTYAVMPETEKEAERTVGNYLRRIAYRRTKLGLPPLKYILVTEYGMKDSGEIIRIHHHIIMNGGLSRDEVEMMWTSERINWRKYDADPKYSRQSVTKLGWVNADRIQVDKNGIEALCMYLVKCPKKKKRWSSSRNLIRPERLPDADHKYSRKKVAELAKSADQGKIFFEKQFPAYTISEVKAEYYEDTGWHIYLKMWKKPKKVPQKQKKPKKAGKGGKAGKR